MSGGRTKYTKEWQAKQNAKGLCRACNEPIAPGSKTRCEFHMKKQEEYTDKLRKKRGLPSVEHNKQARVERHKRVVEYALSHPLETAKQIGEALGINHSTVSTILYNADIDKWALYREARPPRIPKWLKGQMACSQEELEEIKARMETMGYEH